MSIERKSGAVCPDCGARYRLPEPMNSWDYADEPHPDPRDCIRHLRALVEALTPDDDQ